MEPVVIHLGTLRLRGAHVYFDPSSTPTVRAPTGAPVRLVVEYDYEEPSADEDRTRIELVARRGRESLGSAVEVIDDTRIMDDSRRASVMLEARPRERGLVPGEFGIRIHYVRADWRTGDPLERHDFSHDGEFDLEIV